MKRLLQHAGLTSKEALWCLWGAALALVPYVLRCDAIALYWTHMRMSRCRHLFRRLPWPSWRQSSHVCLQGGHAAPLDLGCGRRWRS